MYRRLSNNFGKTKVAIFTAGEEMKKGMFVEKDLVNGEVNLPAAIAGTNVFIVDVEPDITCELSVLNNISDYDVLLNDIAEGKLVSLELMQVGEEYATDQFIATGIAVGDILEVNTAGQLVIGTGTTSPLVATDIAYDDAGHTLLAFTITESLFA